MDTVEDYARKWIKREQEDIDSLSEWTWGHEVFDFETDESFT